MNYSEQILKVRFEQLPKDVKEAIMGTPWEEKLKQISDRHNLHIDQAGHLGEETVLVMFGIEHADNLIPNIAKHVEVSEEKAEAIAEDLNREIFLKVRESLKKMFEEREEGKGNSLLDDSLSAGESSLSGKTEENLNREDILREIEDKEHHNLPLADKAEHHLEIPFPREIEEEPATPIDIHLSSKKEGIDAKDATPVEINISPDQTKKKITELQPDALRTMEKDIFKAKMGGTVSVPKEVVEIVDVKIPPKAKQPNIGSKIDPYRESVG